MNLEKIIADHVRTKYGLGPVDIATHARALSDHFTKGRGSLPKDYLSDKNIRAAYLAHFTLTNEAKTTHCLKQVGEAISTASLGMARPLRVLDLGCGPGSASLATSLFFKERHPNLKVEITAVDQSGEMLKESKELFSALENQNHSYHYIHERIRPRRLKNFLGAERFDIVIAANLLGELGDDHEATRLCKEIFERFLVAGDGLFILVEPALHETSRSLMRIRDHIVESKEASILAPCLHQLKCPMLERGERDWCHFYVEWNRPKMIMAMDELVGTDHRYLKMAYSIFRTSDCGFRNLKSGTVHRVVSSPLVSKGKIELVLCGDDGRLRRVRRLDRDATDSNKGVERAKRGDIICCSSAERIGPTDSVLIRTAWDAI